MFSLVGGVAPAAAVATRPAASATAKSARARPLHLMGFIAPPFEVSAVRVTTAGCFVLLFTVTSPSGGFGQLARSTAPRTRAARRRVARTAPSVTSPKPGP